METVSLTIDDEFCSLMFPLPSAEYEKLERDIFSKGCSIPIIVWQEIIIYNIYHYEICRKLGVPYDTINKHFSTRSEVMSWICRQQLKDSQLSEEARRFLLGKYYEMEKESYIHKATLAGMPPHMHSCQYKIAAQIGAEFNVSSSTVYKYGIYTRAIEDIEKKEPAISNKILSGKLKVSHNNIIELARLPQEQLHILNANLSERAIERISYSELRHELQWKKLPSVPAAPKLPPKQDIPIKQIPKFDPDAELSSLSLTIPSWVSSIKRAQNNTRFPLVSHHAKESLKIKLRELQTTIDTLLESMEDFN